MRKFLQWSLVTLVAIALMAVVVGQMLATTTGRAREASVAVLKEKLARLEAERAVEPVAVPEIVEVTPVAGNDPSHAAIDADALRARWIALFERMAEVSETCRISKEVWKEATRSVIDPEAPALGEEVRETLLEYQSCIEPTMSELHALRDLEPDLGAIFDENDLHENARANAGLLRLHGKLRMSFWIDAALGDAAGVVDAFTSISYFATYAFRSLNFYSWDDGQSGSWILLKPAIADGAVDDVRLNRLYEVLTIHRSLPHFLEEVRGNTEWILESFETWGDVPFSPFRFSEDPIGAARSWAYPRLTPALFNHDFDRFNRAMDRLLDLAAKPYYEVKDDLEQFYEEFDVEPDVESLKFTRGNPGWYYVLSLSRHEFEQNARNQALIDVIRIAILLEKHKRTSGNYPESLEVFAEALGGSVPVNPLMGDAYVYERTEDSFRLGFRQQTAPELMTELGLEDTTVTWWHDPLGYGLEGFDEHPAAEEDTTTESQE